MFAEFVNMVPFSFYSKTHTISFFPSTYFFFLRYISSYNEMFSMVDFFRLWTRYMLLFSSYRQTLFLRCIFFCLWQNKLHVVFFLFAGKHWCRLFFSSYQCFFLWMCFFLRQKTLLIVKIFFDMNVLLKYTILNYFSAADEPEMEIRSFSAKKDRIYVF